MREGSSGPYHYIPDSRGKTSSRYVKLHLLAGEPLYFLVEPKSRSRELHTQVCSYMHSLGMQDTRLFGLSLLLDGEYVFIDPDYKLSKYAPKSWRSSSTNGLDSNGKPLLELFFHVQFYIDSPLVLQDEMSLEHYYRQIEKNVLERGVFGQQRAKEAYNTLAGLSLQAEFGDSYQTKYYTKPHNYLPRQLLESSCDSKISQTLASLHRANCGLSTTEARLDYITEASSPETFQIPYNCHLYRLRMTKQEQLPGSVLLAISTNGVDTYQDSPQKPINGKFLWNDIGKLCFDRKKFEIRGINGALGKKCCYFTSRDEKSKHLLLLCRLTHEYSMAVDSQLAQLRGSQDIEKKQYRDWPRELGKYTSRYCGNGEQRISVISSTSSTTTSGIVSDRVHSLDDSEDDLDLEIMINSPPALSAESLALNQLSESSQSTPSPPPNFEQRQGQKRSPVVVTPATTEGSQCSSSASTIVIQHQQPPGPTTRFVMRSGSVTSSLELGYSHTAEYSGSCDYGSQSAHCTASSGVYTLDDTSDQHTVLDTVASSSGIGLQSEQRSRSGSLVSNSGSFHGDGSDPSDAGRGNLLTAEELSNLIVHRSPKPRRGVYPSRATVSSTLDSCSDYVTLPPPPIPPPSQDNKIYAEPKMLCSLGAPPGHHQPPEYTPLPPPHPIASLPSPKAQETSASFITTKPQISILTAHSGFVSSNLSLENSHYEPSARMKIQSNLLPIVGSNNYLDVRKSYLQQFHPQPPYQKTLHIQPPPPPPRANLATVYTNQVSRSQIEQFKEQLYSDVDYVMYPLKEPALSKQEYLESKAARQTPPPPYPSGRNAIYRSTPNVALQSGYLPFYNKSLAQNKFASNQNLSDYYLSTSPLYSATGSYSSSSTHSLLYDPSLASSPFYRTLSHDNILNFERPPCERTRYRRPPPPIPSDPVAMIGHESNSRGVWPELQKPRHESPEAPLDISSLREKSKNLDLPLISALCNDRSLLKQTNAFVMPRHPDRTRPVSWHVDTSTEKKSIFSTLLSKSISNPTPSSKHSKLKYPVSGLSTNQIVKGGRKATSRHKHPEISIDEAKGRGRTSSSKDIK